MPIFDDRDRTEAPTPHKRRTARDAGRVARSQDLNVAVLLLAACAGVYVLGMRSLVAVSMMMEDGLARMAAFPGGQDSLLDLLGAAALWIARVVGPFAALALLVGVAANVAQIGFLFSGAPLRPDFENVGPARGLARIFSLRGLTRTVFGVLKITAVGCVLVWTVWEELTRQDGTTGVLRVLQASWSESLTYAVGVVATMGFRSVIALLVLAILDLLYQRWQFENDLMMTKQEVREEMLRMEGDPKVKERRKKVRQQLAYQRMMREVPRADVVVAKARYAVAIRYDRTAMDAPNCVARGEGRVAQRIRELAMESGVAVVERPELARALYRAVEVGHEIPGKFYRAVAETLAFVYRGSRPPRTAGAMA